MKVAGYIYGFNKKKTSSYDYNRMSDYLVSKAGEKNVEIDSIYADGWDDIPNGLEELIADVNNYEGVVLYSLEGLDIDSITSLGVVHLYCITAPWIAKNKVLEYIKISEAALYYGNMRSLNIRMGINLSDKQSGVAPYGYKHNPEGKLEPVSEEIENINQILAFQKQGLSVKEISERVDLKPSKIYRIQNAHKS